MSKSKTRPNYSPEVRERAVRMVLEQTKEHSSQWAAIVSIAAKIGCTAQTLHNWVAQAERDRGERAGLSTDERERMKSLERENRELRQANEILRKASDPPPILWTPMLSSEGLEGVFSEDDQTEAADIHA